jgi:hypothetical protein
METGRNETIALHRWAVIAEATNDRRRVQVVSATTAAL